ncbi:MAG: maleylacetoacetate isomerase [Robiginitomaculum sp.]|nr:maleylacetoacetate isomerase [Robiginitomaculum sp.]MDQ7078550.1 maleylacetoacetate isomerase [Robiginitomaculum sp.]
MIRLYNYYRSGTSHRVRIALHLKDVPFEYVPVNLLEKEHKSAAYQALNPQGLAPAITVDGHTLTQSPAILEWIEESWPEPPLLPTDRFDRARVRAMAALIACDIHPINNLRILNALKSGFGADQSAVLGWIARWIYDGFAALEVMLKADSQRGDFCFGKAPGLVECNLIPQVYAARRFEVDLTPFPTITAIDAACAALPAFEKAHPANQPDAV